MIGGRLDVGGSPVPRPRAHTRPASWVVVAVAAALILGGCAASGSGQFSFVAPGGQTRIFYDPPEGRRTVPPLAGDALTAPGRAVGLDNSPGQVVVVNVWGSWCGPCRSETPQLELVQRRTRVLGVQFLGIDVRDDRSAAADFVRDRAVRYPSIFDPPGRSLLALRGYPRNVVPSTIVLDREHRVAAVFLTAVLAGDVEPLVRRLAAEPVPTGPPARAPSPPPRPG